MSEPVYKCPVCGSTLEHPLDLHSQAVRSGVAKIRGSQMTEKKMISQRLNAQKPRPNRRKNKQQGE